MSPMSDSETTDPPPLGEPVHLCAMSDAVSRLNAALEGRYTIEREFGEGGMAMTSSTSARSP